MRADVSSGGGLGGGGDGSVGGAAGGGGTGGGAAGDGRRRLRLRREAWGFAVGSVFFLVGALPWYAAWAGPVGAAATFVVGSVFFTLAAFVQLSLSGRRIPVRGTNRADAWDWWAAAVQFVGTLLFNVSTAAGPAAALADPERLGAGWRPDAWGSAAFLISSAFAMVATSDRGTLWDVHARSWHGTWLTMLGSIAFAVSAVGAYVVPQTDSLVSAFWANLGTLVGAVCFLLAALLSRRAIDAPATRAG
ncbi:hypothetical protein [Agromyces terreus]|uniref:hypothetical protein n=1 Tax=Agromyces terreus TaxID=424795 RepID=UPI0031E45197